MRKENRLHLLTKMFIVSALPLACSGTSFIQRSKPDVNKPSDETGIPGYLSEDVEAGEGAVVEGGDVRVKMLPGTTSVAATIRMKRVTTDDVPADDRVTFESRESIFKVELVESATNIAIPPNSLAKSLMVERDFAQEPENLSLIVLGLDSDNNVRTRKNFESEDIRISDTSQAALVAETAKFASALVTESNFYFAFGTSDTTDIQFENPTTEDEQDEQHETENSIAASPTYSPPGGSYAGVQTISVSTSTDGATIYFTVDGTVPTAASGIYTGPITVTSSQTLKAIATKEGLFSSQIGSAAYSITHPASCKAIKDAGISNDGTYFIQPAQSPTPLQVYCDMTTHGGGWTLCFSGGKNRKGTTEADGFDFLSSVWKSGSDYVFASDNQTSASYGNFCSVMTHDEVFGKRFSSPSSLYMTTQVMNATGNLFKDPATRLVNGVDEIASVNRTVFSMHFYGGSACAWETYNIYEQASSLCVSVGNDYQVFQGNLNESIHAVGDHLCAFNQLCQYDLTSSVIQLLVR